MNDLSHPLLFLLAHPSVIVVLLACWAFVIVIGAMPALPPNAGYFTQWTYAILQGFAGNFKKIAHLAEQTPQGKILEQTLLSKTTEITPAQS